MNLKKCWGNWNSRGRPNVEDEIFEYAKKYIQSKSKYSPYVYPDEIETQGKFPLVLIKYEDDPLYDECLAKEEQKYKVSYEIEIYAENQANQVKQEIRKELVDLVNDVFDEHFGFTRKENKNVPNADLNLDRRHMRFVAIIDENKRIYRGNYVGQ